MMKIFHKKWLVPWDSKINYTIHDTCDMNFIFDVTLLKFIDDKSTKWRGSGNLRKKEA
jgi:hypothetical protein